MAIEENSLVLLDTNCFIYFFEDNETYAQKLEDIFNNIQEGKNKAIMSVLSLMEILVLPKKQGNVFLENRYKLMLTNYPNLKIIDVDFNIADTAAMLRAKYSIKAPDSIIIATALQTKARYVITNDIRLKNVCEKENIEAITLDEI